MQIIRNFFCVLTVATTLISFAGSAAARDLTVVSWGGAYQDSQRKIFFEPFSKESGVKVLEDSWDGGIGMLRTRAESDDGGWDVVQVEREDLLLGCNEGLFLKMDFTRIGGEESYIPEAVSECGVGNNVYNFVLTYDTSKLKNPPQGWVDFFDLKKYPGKRALRQGPKGNLEIALMADGVAPGDVYKTLNSTGGVERAFKKLDTIKPQLLFWKTGGQPMQFLASGEVAMSSVYNPRVTNAVKLDKKPFGMVWNQSLQTMDSWVILANSPNVDKAYGLLKVMGRGDTQRLWPEAQHTGITSKAGIAQTPASELADSPTSEQNKQNILIIDDQFWVDRIDEINAKWAAWSAR
ncbi:ABC transporter substrate-binding protein [Pseudomonas syringae]|uniref:ABC transporter substrate-binding protein n=1 Tax=Pseudomonas syringae TaxID=317 RepID=UPI001F48D336|nr:ABC transporter substrate-binding protein [Pseudomonas syringae]MCF5724133.1 extracellular solute-binding protein [Pseudomonas syringae]